MAAQRFIAAGAATLLAGSSLPALPAAAQQARPPAQITVSNMRAAALTTFEIATTGDQPRLVAKLAKPLAPGKSVSLKLNRPSGCSYFVLARFDDAVESDSEGMDLCADRVIRLTE